MKWKGDEQMNYGVKKQPRHWNWILVAGILFGVLFWVCVALLIFGVPKVKAATAKERATYGTCYSLRGRMANGDYVHWGAVASNVHRLGTKIRLTERSFYGRRKFIVKDTGGALWDGHLDFWHPSTSACYSWGKRTVKYKIGWRKR